MSSFTSHPGVIPCESARSSTAKEILCGLLACILLCWNKTMWGKPWENPQINDWLLISLRTEDSLDFITLSWVNLTGSKIQLLLVWEHCNMKGWLTSNYHVKCCCRLVILFCLRRAQKMRREQRETGDGTSNRRVLTCHQTCWEGLLVTILDTVCLILLWHYSCARQTIASVLNIFRRHQLRNQGSKHMRLTNMNNLTRCR